MIGAVGTELAKTHRTPGADVTRIQVPDVFTQVQRVGVICQVNRKRFGVVVNGDVYGPAKGDFYTSGGAPAAGEVVDYDLSRVRHERTSSR